MVYVVLPMFFVFALILAYGNLQARKAGVIKVQQDIRQYANIYAKQINLQLRDIAEIAEITANILSLSDNLSEQQYYDLLEKKYG